VVDRNNHRIQKFDSNGQFLTQWGSNGNGDGQFDLPHSLAVDEFGNVYVGDTRNVRVQKFDNNGNFLTKWGSRGIGNGQFGEVFGVAVDGSGSVYVTDRLNRAVQKFDSNGAFITRWGRFGTADGLFYDPQGITVDDRGAVYVTDVSLRRIQKFNSNGQFLSKWGSSGQENGQFEFSGPWGVAADGKGTLYVADPTNNRVQIFGQTATQPTLLTIRQQSQPQSVTNFRFGSEPTTGIGRFVLDDPAADDGDGVSNSKTFTVNPGSYTLTQVELANWWVSAIDCTPFIKGNVTLAQRNVLVTIAAGDQVTCTFTNQRRGAIFVRLFHDVNGNGVRNSSEAWLPGWNVQLYQAPGQLLGAQNSDSTGAVRFTQLLPGNYVVCEVLPPGWFLTAPSAYDPAYGQPCQSLTVTSGGSASVRFGNHTQPVTVNSAASADLAVHTGPLPETDDDDNLMGAEQDPWASEAAAEGTEETGAMRYQLFLPILTR
jgi:sugar lactone lactonase YvrE